MKLGVTLEETDFFFKWLMKGAKRASTHQSVFV